MINVYIFRNISAITSNMKISHKLIVGFILVAILSLAIGIFSYNQLSKVGHVYTEALDKDAMLSLTSENVKSNKRQMENIARAYEITGNPNLRDQFEEEAKGMERKIQQMLELAETEKGRERVSKLKELYAVYVSSARNYMNTRDIKQEKQNYLEAKLFELEKLMKDLEVEFDKIDEAIKENKQIIELELEKATAAGDAEAIKRLNLRLIQLGELSNLVSSLEINIRRGKASVSEFVARGDSKEKSDFEKYMQRADARIASAEKLVNDDEYGRAIIASLNSIKTLKKEFENTGRDAIISQEEKLNAEKRLSEFRDKFDAAGSKMTYILNEIIQSNLDELESTKQEADAAARKAGMIILGVALGALGTGAMFGISISRGISRPVEKLMRDAEKVAKGDYSHEITINRKDEIGELANSLRTMIRSIVDNIVKANIALDLSGAVMITDKDLKVTYVNKGFTELTGISAEEAKGKYAYSLLPIKEKSEYKAAKALQTEDIVTFETQRQLRSGEWIPVEVTAAPLKDSKGRIIGLIEAIKDLRELKKKEREILEVKDYLEAEVDRLLPVVMSFAEGDLTKSITSEKHDAFGKLITTFDKSRENLARLVSKVKFTSERVASTAEEQAASSEQLNAAGNEITTAIHQIAVKAQNLAELMDTGNREMGNLADMTGTIAENVELAAESAKKVENAVKQGSASATDADKSLQKIRKLSTKSAEKVRKLGERSREISEIVDMISSIAEQTNLLALNAAIEAARAGEHGKGFAVVAEEVRKLAESSAKAAEQIATMIQEVQQDVEEAVEAIESGTNEVEAGTEVVAGALKSLEEIAKAVEESTAKIIQIRQAAEEQKRISEKVVRKIEEAANNAQDVASATQEASAGMEEQKASMDQLAASAQELARLAQELDETVSRFRVDEKITLKIKSEI